MLILDLAWRDLLRDRFFLLCNVAVMVGILVPLLLLFGVKNGVYQALIGEMLADPANLQIDTAGNGSFTEADLAGLHDWPEIAFLTPKVRGQFDYMNVRAAGGGRIVTALVVPSGAGDPTLPEGIGLAEGEVAVSARLARLLELSEGQAVQLISQAEGRPRQLLLVAHIAAVLDDAAVAGRSVLAPYPLLDVIEAFYDSYALPDYGITAGRDLAERTPVYEGVRVYAHRLEDVAPLQARIEAALDIATVARTRDIEALLDLGRKLNMALGLTAALAALGLGAALVLGFWSEVARKRVVLAGIALIGVPGRALALFPVAQALMTAVLGLALSFAAYGLAGRLAGRLFGDGLPGEAALAVIGPGQGALICGAVLGLVLLASGGAAWAAQQLDPASVLREGT
ncbi:MAG: ABC transporter permease [Antarcticimicrobium sp.]|uniref:ABC transporter permease n=1 Tax=Antarcticimicrobium sp. TaxID=2824147 RepID=UPI00261D1689|nr:ABC transporter permease [Antarcticimicrobium sp.]MDF1717771.1 ABC transporter permease [Antarcticimicrobium sp.]